MEGISDALPPPTECDECKSERVKLYWNKKHKRAKYVCLDCGASVYCHGRTDIPLGYMGTGHTRYLRAKTHEVFDPLWMHGLITRDQAYQWLARQLNVPVEQAHIARLTDEQLERVGPKCARYYRKLMAKAKRQKAIDDATNRRQRTRARKRKSGGKWKPRP